MRINRIVSVILNGVVLNRLAQQHGHDVNAMTDSLLSNLSAPLRRNVQKHGSTQLGINLKSEISKRINISQTV